MNLRKVSNSRKLGRSRSPAAPGPAAPSSPTEPLVLVSLVLVAAAVRLIASRGDLWLDEIWSLQLARSLQSSLEVLTKQHLDNNHCLNTWLMWVLRGSGSDWVYRIPALVAGVSTVILAGGIGRRVEGGRTGTLSAILLTGGSFLLIQYGSEARGYALAGAFALAAWLIGLHGLSPGTGWRWPVIFWCAVILGVLSHATFIAQAYAGLFVWSAVRLGRQARSWRAVLRSLLRWHAVPLAFVVFFHLVHLRHLEIGGGPRFAWRAVLGRLSLYTLGLPAGGVWAGLGLLAALVFLAAALVVLWRRRSDLWVLYAANCLVFPAALLLYRQPERLYERYFFVSATFLLVLLSQLAAAGIRRRGIWSLAVVVLLAGFLAGNTIHTLRLLRHGRGHYAAALLYITRNTPPDHDVIRIASDHDFRNRMLIEYYAGKIRPDRRIVYVTQADLPKEGAEWMILHSRDESSPHLTAIAAGGRGPYRFQKAFPSAPLSGFHWFPFRLEPEPPSG